MIKVSIVVPTYQKLGHLRSMLGALEQIEFPRQELEVIVVDDGSTDGTREFLDGWSGDLPLRAIHQANSGAAVARNTGAAAATGALLMMVDDDCLVSPSAVGNLWRAHREAPESLLISSIRHVAVWHVDEVLPRAAASAPDLFDGLDDLAPEDDEYALAGIIREMLASGIDRFSVPWVAGQGAALAFPRTVFEELGGFDQEITTYGMEDFDIAYRHHRSGRGFVGVLDSVLYHLDHGHQRNNLFRESTRSTRYFYRKYSDRQEISLFIKFLCGVISFRDFNNRVARAEGLPRITDLEVRFSPYGMVRYRDRQLAPTRDRDSTMSYTEGQQFKLRFLLQKLRRDLEGEAAELDDLTMLEGFEDRKIVVIAPHMDDEVIGCGGLIRRSAEKGSTVVVIFLTDGASRNLPDDEVQRICRLRREESAKATEILGVDHCVYLDIPERRLFEAVHEAEPLTGVFRDEAPDLILLPGPEEYHPDHRSAYSWVKLALESLKAGDDGPGDDGPGDDRPELMLYEVWGSCRPDSILELDAETWRRKTEALAVYETQLQQLDYREIMTVISDARGKSLNVVSGRAEAFRSVDELVEVG